MVVNYSTRPNFQAQVLLVFSFATRLNFQAQVLLVSSHIGSSKDELGEDLCNAKSSESSSEVGLSGATLVSGDGDSSPSEGPDYPFILPDVWEFSVDQLARVERATSFFASECNWRVLVTIDDIHKEGKLQLPTPGEKRKFIMDTSPKTFGTITRPKKTPNHPSSTPACLASIDRLRVHKKIAILETKVKGLGVQCVSHANLFIFVEEEKIHLSKDLGKLQEEMSNAKMRVVAKYSTSQEYHNDLGLCYVRGFEHFCTQALAAFKDLDFSNFEINLEEGSSATMVGGGVEQGGDNIVDEETKGDNQTGHQT
uniref:Uncharacterized protein n=1 Tax=Quercus lobata TaxID=97700 RepID=A0A7N2LH96_QUELO